MLRKRADNKIIALLLIALMLPINYFPTPVQAYEDTNSDNVHINTLSKYLYLGDNRVNSYDFNLEGIEQDDIKEYSWYIQPDQGYPGSVKIDKTTGEVTARKAGTAYICCDIKYKDGTILKPEAQVIVINDITEVLVSSPSETNIFTAGQPINFNRIIVNTSNGKGKRTEGITRWEITDDTAGAGSADSRGVVYPTKEGSFKVRAVCFQDEFNYKRWLRKRNDSLITAASEWQTIQVVASDGTAVVNSQGQLEKALATEEFKEITLFSIKPDTFKIDDHDYSDKTLIVDTPNGDIHNYGKFLKIIVNAVKESTWIEYANGNIVHLQDDQLSFVIEEGSVVKQIVIDKADSAIHLDIRGQVESLSLLQPANLILSGSSQEIPLTISENAGKSIIASSVPLNVTMRANAKIILNQGAEASRIDKNEQSVEAYVENNTLSPVSITTNQSGPFIINARTSGISDKSTIPTPLPGPGKISITGLTLKPEHMVMSVTGSAIYMFGVMIEPYDANDIKLTWRSADESIALVDQCGVVTPVAEGTTPVFVEADEVYAMAYVTVVSGSVITASGSAIQGGLLQSAGSTIAKELGKGAASYVGGQLMGWGLKQAGIGFEDETQVAIDKMIEKLDDIILQLQNLEVQLENAVKRIENAIDRSEFNTRVGQMSGLIGNINSIRNELNTFIKNADEIKPELLSVYKNNILANINSKLISKEYEIHNQLVGIGGQESLIKLYSRYIKNNKRFLTKKDTDAVNVVYEYFKAVQENMLELMTEYYHTYLGSDNDLINVNRILNTFNENIAAQEKLLLSSIPEDVVIDTTKNIMIYTGDYYRICYESNPFKFYKQTIKGPCYYNNIDSGIQAEKYMNYNLNYPDWRLLTKSELESWTSVSNGDFHGLLANTINMPLNPMAHIMIIERIPVFEPFGRGWTYRLEYDAYRVSNGQYNGALSSGPQSALLGSPYLYSYYYYIVCRTMSAGEISNFFW